MSVAHYYLNTSQLPNDVLSYTDQDFYNFVEMFLGKLHARLLSYLHISSVPCFLLTENPCAILTLDIDDEVLEQLSQETCIKLKNNQLIVKPGVENSFKCLKELLKKKIEEHMKTTKRNIKQQVITVANTNSTQSFSLSSSMSTSSPSLFTSSCSPLTIDEHHQYLLNCIRQWCIDNKANLRFNEFELKEDVDFTFIFSNINNFLEISIQCKCGSKINLGKNAEKFQLSNYYKHLKDTRCSHMNALKKKAQEQMQNRQHTGINLTATSSPITNNKRRIDSQSSQKAKQKKEH
ncbi:unnamed protein product [Rotaria sordida]|uniref:Uncharacterized protein n=1 Tax=Rotaria sordida TaxID=392033 RepID=A0A819IF83_9BILA|nr:unnamed protein product [Rotaria sordida]CAF1621490.1 unnamed protein product [Rotaria sordida]CAF3915370.1 unnamed protein product [Rotaria sordida]